MIVRELLFWIFLALAVASLVAAKFLWAFTLWYEWIALGVAAVCLVALKLLARAEPKHTKQVSSDPGNG
jgi:hypothetical protein